MNILALDPSSKTIGWAVSRPFNLGRGCYSPLDWRAVQRSEFDRHRHMCGMAGEWLADMITDHDPDVVVIETPVPIRNSACLQRLLGALMLVLWTREILTHPVSPSLWQGWAKRCLPERLTEWQTNDKPDDVAAELILEWFISTQAHRVQAA